MNLKSALVRDYMAGRLVTFKHCLKIALNAGYYGDSGGPVSEYMTPDVETIDAEMSIIDLAQKFLKCGYRRFPVLRNNRLVGQISRRDVLRALNELAVSA